ncbi:uncharacterized protein AKAW2_80781S [Aspergillus luchuensis]|uniref:Uncharacterized protein n=1 Tax=Aspergillus kawachii TaxID=1069201 RepID=A0A7R7WLQ0_ASPKA|nr:uncharacterized protein AKAW2_80781S [Aspergillus luchuensis]BCS04980.1 hypothetical protein AKAW2_80781S [Aspergillus luchuensis]
MYRCPLNFQPNLHARKIQVVNFLPPILKIGEKARPHLAFPEHSFELLQLSTYRGTRARKKRHEPDIKEKEEKSHEKGTDHRKETMFMGNGWRMMQMIYCLPRIGSSFPMNAQ